MAAQTESSIVIDAPHDQVLAVIRDLERYPEWNDIKSVDVVETDAAGRPVAARFVLDTAPIKDTYTLAYTWGPDHVSWTLTEASLLRSMDGSYTLAPAGAATEVTYRLAVELSIPMIGLIKRRAEKAIVDTALRGLKERVESGAHRPNG